MSLVLILVIYGFIATIADLQFSSRISCKIGKGRMILKEKVLKKILKLFLGITSSYVEAWDLIGALNTHRFSLSYTAAHDNFLLFFLIFSFLIFLDFLNFFLSLAQSM